MSERLTDEQVADQAEWWAAGLIPGAPLPHPLLLAREVQEWRRTVLGIDPDTVLTRTCETCGGKGYRLRMICCGRDDGFCYRATVAELEAIRESYIDAEGHDRQAVIESCPDCDNGTVEVNRIMVGPPCTCGDRFADYVCHSAYKPCYHPTDLPNDATVIGPDDARALWIGQELLKAKARHTDANGKVYWGSIYYAVDALLAAGGSDDA